jgi:hypothetical protein
MPLFSRCASFRGLVYPCQTFARRRQVTDGRGGILALAGGCKRPPGGGHDWKGGPGRWGWGQFPAGVSVGRGADRYLNSARLLCVRERTSPTPVCRSDPGSGLAHLRQRFDLGSHGPKQGQLAPLHFWLTNRINIPTAISRATRVPMANDRARLRRSSGFDPAPFCAAPMPSQKRRLPID